MIQAILYVFVNVFYVAANALYKKHIVRYCHINALQVKSYTLFGRRSIYLQAENSIEAKAYKNLVGLNNVFSAVIVFLFFVATLSLSVEMMGHSHYKPEGSRHLNTTIVDPDNNYDDYEEEENTFRNYFIFTNEE